MPRKKKQVISKDHLEKLVENRNNISTLLNNIGVLEVEKSNVLQSLKDAYATMEQIKKELEEVYGSVTINVETGEYKLNENGTDTKD